MSVSLRSCALLLALATAAGTAEPEVEELFKQARDKVLDNARRMPRYTCVETVSRTQFHPPDSPSTCESLITMRRLVSTRGRLELRDRLRLDVAVVDGGEIFSWAGAGKFETHDVDKIVGGGASGSGEFGSFLASVFGSAPDAIRYTGLRNDFAQFEYNVPTAKSNYKYRTSGPGRIIGYHGTFSLDPADGDVQQLVVDSDQFAPADGVCRVQHIMRFSRVKIGGGDFVLPEVSTMEVLYRNGAESLNDTRYSECREYVGESTIRFDEVDAATGPAAARDALQPLPSKTRLLIGLSKPINTEIAAAGDPVEGVLLRDAVDRRMATAARVNDRVHGRILRLQQYLDPPAIWVVAIRFDTIERNSPSGSREQPIALNPVDDGERPAQRVRNPTPQGVMQRPEGAGVFFFTERGNIVLDQNFHSEWETR
jgi:hypothetical protein